MFHSVQHIFYLEQCSFNKIEAKKVEIVCEVCSSV